MQVLLTAATPFEIGPAIAWLEQEFEHHPNGRFVSGTLEVEVAVTGVGMLSTGWHLAMILSQSRPDFAINAGIVGALDMSLQLGDVVFIDNERFADLGVEEADGRFTDLFELGLHTPDTFPFSTGRLINPVGNLAGFLPKANGLTVNKVHGSANSIAALRQKYPDAQVESMEGAAFFFACLQAKVPFAEIRAISNYVEPRNRDSWDLPGSIKALNEVVINMLGGLRA